MPKLPNGDRAEIDRRKIDGYVLDPEHRTGRHKARVFAAALGMRADHADVLIEACHRAVAEGECRLERQNEHGAHYSVAFILAFRGRSARVRSLWVVRPNEDFPRFVSAFVIEDDDRG